jgi:hypothetical protein
MSIAEIHGLHRYLRNMTILISICYMGLPLAQDTPSTLPDQGTLSQFSPRPLSYAIDTSNASINHATNGESNPVIKGINIQEHNAGYKTHTIETVLEPQQQVEYMINMEQGDILLFTWEMDGRIYFDMHGHQENVDPEIWVQYTEGRQGPGHGSFTAPYTGEHGWFWANLDNRPLKLTLTITGFYQNIFRIDL